MSKEKEFFEALKKSFQVLVEKEKARLLEETEEYDLGFDCDEVDVGVGYVTVRKDVIQDEEKAEEDAKKNIIEYVRSMDEETIEYLMYDENEVYEKLAKILEGF